MAPEILIKIEKLINNFDDIYVEAQKGALIKIVHKDRVLVLSKEKPKRKRTKKPKQEQ